MVLNCRNILAQISEPGTPLSFLHNELYSIENIPYVSMPNFNVSELLKEDSLNEIKSGPYRYAKCFDVSYSLNNSGVWESLENGDKVWRIGIKSERAHLQLEFYLRNIICLKELEYIFLVKIKGT